MRRIINILLVLTLLSNIFSIYTFADDPWKEDYYRISDLSGELEVKDRYDLDRKIIDFMAENHQDIVVIAIPTERLHGYDAEEFGREYFLESGFGYGEEQNGFIGVYLTDANTYDLVRIGSAEDEFDDSDVELAEELVPTFYDKYGMYGVIYGAIRTVESVYEEKAEADTVTDTDKADVQNADAQKEIDNGLFSIRDANNNRTDDNSGEALNTVENTDSQTAQNQENDSKIEQDTHTGSDAQTDTEKGTVKMPDSRTFGIIAALVILAVYGVIQIIKKRKQ